MAKLELLDQDLNDGDVEKKKKMKKINHGSTQFFVFVDYLFLFIFFVVLCFNIFKMIGI